MMVLDASRKSSLGELASALAHELNQPLTAVTNYIKRLSAGAEELRHRCAGTGHRPHRQRGFGIRARPPT